MKSGVTLDAGGPGLWRLGGVVDFETAPEAWGLLRPVLGGGGDVVLSLRGVQRANSAALGVLLECLDLVRSSGGRLILRDVPATLRDLAAMSNLQAVLSLDGT